MSDYMSDLTGYFVANGVGNYAAIAANSRKDSTSLDMTDFLTLMVAQFQNQSMDSQADTSDMLNQMVQMQMVQALVNMTDASIMTYASSLVGKEVTVGTYDANGDLVEYVGLVTGTGTANGSQVVFVDGVAHQLSEIMAVGRLPEMKEPEGETENAGSTDPVGGAEDAQGSQDGTEDADPVPETPATESTPSEDPEESRNDPVATE